MLATDEDVDVLLTEKFGHQEFRPGQREVIRALLRGRDALAVLPTGAGKSLAYQLTAQLLPGATLVVSPLLALMQDQVDSLRANGLDVSTVSSALSDAQAAAELDKLAGGAAKLLYVTPERFENAEFMDAIRRMRVALFVVDEAHCVTEWGHSFRPAYLRLADAIARLGRPTVLALTATATPWVRAEIAERLGLRDPAVVVRGIDRPNLFFEVRRVESEDEDRRTLKHLLTGDCAEYPEELAPGLCAAMRGSGIIYTATTAAARATAEWLREWGVAADYYHGQRAKAERAAVQERFMSGELRVIAATNAFGLGIDKPDVRFVVHRDIPASPEAYYQEAGRAGRDGELARCVLIYRPGDLGRAAFLAAGGQLTRAELERAWAGMQAHPRATVRELRAATELGQADLLRAIDLLKRARAIAERRGRIELRKPDFDLAGVSLEDEERRRAYERSRVEMMRGYAESSACRRRYLLSYFGDDEGAPCAMCDVDMPRATDERVPISRDRAAPAGAAPFGAGARVAHERWGAGVVQSADANSLTVLFEAAGYKRLALADVLERGLLRAAA
jgi:ATP-dependent DNA helicase RecQ